MIYIHIYIYIFICCFFALKKSEQAEIVAFNRLVVNYHIHFLFICCLFALKKSEQAEIVAFNRLVVNYNIQFLFYWRGYQRTRVDSCDTGRKNMEWKNE